MIEFLREMAQIASCVTGIVAAAILFVKPLQEKVLGTNAIREGQKCLLRHNMMSTYYKHHEEKTIRQYEKEDFICEYKAYKALHGNSFIDSIYKEVIEWEVLS